MKWYALQEDRTDPWDNGTYDIQEALNELYNNQYINFIAVIENDLCVKEIEKSSVCIEYCIVDNKWTNYYVDDVITLGDTADEYMITSINDAARTLTVRSLEDPAVNELLTFIDLSSGLRAFDGKSHRITAESYYYIINKENN